MVHSSGPQQSKISSLEGASRAGVDSAQEPIPARSWAWLEWDELIFLLTIDQIRIERQLKLNTGEGSIYFSDEELLSLPRISDPPDKLEVWLFTVPTWQ